MTYSQNYFNNLLTKIDATNVSSDSLYALNKMTISELPDTDLALANTDFNNIYLPSMNKIMGLLEKSSSADIHDMELLVAKQQQIMESIIDHETAHSLEYIHKRIGMQIYNEKLLPKLLDGSMGVYDEASFEANREHLRSFMSDEFMNTYDPNEQDLADFNNFVREYYLPDGPFGVGHRVSEVDNYITDVEIENGLKNVLLEDGTSIDKKFQSLRALLYENSNPEQDYSIMRSIQIFIDPRFEGTKQLEKVKNSEKFKDFLNIDISNLNISPELFKLTTPDDYEYMKMIVIMKELQAIIKKIREYNYLSGGYYLKYKEDHKIDSGAVSLLSSKLAKVIYIKELENQNDKEKEIFEIIKNDKHIGYKKKNNSNENDGNESREKSKEKNALSDLSKPEYKETIKKIGHQGDYSDELNGFMKDTVKSIENHLESNIVQQAFDSNNKNDKDIISQIINKPISSNNFEINKDLELRRLELFSEIKDSNDYKRLVDIVEDLKKQLGNVEFKNNAAGNMNNVVDDYINGNEFLYSMNGNQKINTFIHCFIDDSMSMKNKFDDKYTLMDYQIVNTMLILDLLKDVPGIDVVVSNFADKGNSMNLLYDSNKSNNTNIIALDATKVASPLYQSIVETNVKLKSMDTNKDIVNIYMSDGDDNMNPTKFKVSQDLFENIVEDSYFIQLKGKEIQNIEKNFDDRYFIVKEKDDITNNLIKTMSKLVENLEYKIEIDNNLEKSFK